MNARRFGSEIEITTTWSFEDNNSATRLMHEGSDYMDLKL